MSSANVISLRPFDSSAPVSKARNDKILLLQGPIGPFFQELQAKFDAIGYDAWRVNFNAADRLHSGRKKILNFKGGPDEYYAWLEKLLETMDFQAVIIFGASKPIHKVARDLCDKLAIPVISLEEGYVRPGFVSVERGANNYQSPIASQLPPEDYCPASLARVGNIGSSLMVMGRYATVYYIIHALFSSKREKALFHKPERTNLVKEFFCWNRNFLRRFTNQRRDIQSIEKLLQLYSKKFFLVPFQVTDDSQLSPDAANGWTNETLAMHVIESFATYGNKNARLVFKVHPLERGHSALPALVRRLAHMHGVSDRVDVIDFGSLGLLAKQSAGMITINSSAGLSAIFHGIPLGVLGFAIYGNPQLATLMYQKGDIDAFWTKRHVAPVNLRKNYLSWLNAQCLVIGDFYLDYQMEVAVSNVAARCIEIMKTRVGKHDNVLPLLPVNIRPNHA